MMDALHFTSKEQVFDFLDDYACRRKEQIDRHQLGKDQGLIKSYLLETLPTNGEAVMDVPDILRGTGWQITPVDNAEFYRVRDKEGELGFLEPLSSRHLALHSIKEARRTDKALRNTVSATAQLDFTWLAGSTFQTIWEHLVLPEMPDRFVTFKFEHLARFEDSPWDGQEAELDEDWSAEELVERRASTLAITERSQQIERFLHQLQSHHPPFKAIKMLRIPAAEAPGGYDFWSWGKVTHRAQTFRGGRTQILSITRLYERTTRAIERRLWLQAEKTTLRDGRETMTLTGAPVTLTFDPPLSLSTFRNFVTTTFERGQGPLRLWGNPIPLGEQKVHVYGIDLHLWKRIYLEITPWRMIAVLPRGTCGNTVHRLVTNVQRYLDPTVKVCIADERYKDLVEGVFLGQATR
jgi:hypothetical protein